MNHISESQKESPHCNYAYPRAIFVNYRKIIIVILLFLSLCYAYPGQSFSTEWDTIAGSTEFIFTSFSFPITRQINFEALLAILGIVWFADQILTRKGVDLGNNNYFLKALVFRSLIVIPLALAVSLVLYGIPFQLFWIRIFLVNLLIPITFIFSWEATRKRYVTLDFIVKAAQILLLLTGVYLLAMMLLNSTDISTMATRKEVFNLHFVLMMIVLFSISAVNLLVRNSETRLMDVMGVSFSSLVLIFSLKRVAWLELVAVILILFYAMMKNSSKRALSMIRFAVVVFFVLVMMQPLLQIYGGTFGDIGSRFASIFSIFSPGSQEQYGTSVFLSTNTLSGHDLALAEGIYNVKESPILGKGFFAQYELYFLDDPRGLGGGPHAGYFFNWIREGLLGFSIIMFVFGYLVFYGWRTYGKRGDKYALLLVLLGSAEFLRGIAWPNLFNAAETYIPYMIIFGALLRYLYQSNISKENMPNVQE